jgi:hypothetical protein
VNLVKLSLALATAFVMSACSLDLIYDTLAIPDKDGSGNGSLHIRARGGPFAEKPIRYTTPPGPFEAHAKVVREHKHFLRLPTYFTQRILDTGGNTIYFNSHGLGEPNINVPSKTPTPTVAEADLSATAPAVADVSANQSDGVNPLNGITNPLDVIPPSLLDGYVEPDDDDDDDDD